MRLVALVVLPIVAVAVLGVQRMDTERQAADDASALVDAVELRAAVTRVIPAAQLERAALVGLAKIDEIGVPRDLVVGFVGIDFESIYNDNQVELDHALDELSAVHSSRAVPDGDVLGERLQNVEAQLAEQRELSAEGRASVAEIDAVFDELDAVLGEVLSSDDAMPTSSVALDRRRAQLDSLGPVVLSAGDLNRTFIDGLFSETPDPIAFARAEAAHQAYLDTFASTVADGDREAIELITARRLDTARDDEVSETVDDAATVVTSPDLIRAAAETALAQFAYLNGLADYTNDLLERTADEVRGEATDARAAARRTEMLMWTTAALTLVLIAGVLWSILVPIRRLAHRADRVSRGELDLEPLPIRGPTGVRRLTATMNEMPSALGRVNDEITRLASGDIDADGVGDIPGPIGVSLRNSVQHLTSVTAMLHRSEALASAIIDQADDSIWTIDDEGTILTSNEASVRLVGRSIEEQSGRPISELLSQTTGEASVLTRTQPPVRVLVARSVIDAGDDRVTAVIAHDISERSRFEERLTYQAMHDALTGLPNRFALLDHVEALRRDHPGEVAVLYLDLDGFKSVNDVQGHAVGDRVLAEIASKLASSVRQGEFVGRLGGDEFVVVTPRFSKVDDVMALANRLVREVELPYEEDGQFFSLSVSIGVAVPPADAEPLDMIGQADNAVYQAKRQGRGRVVLFDSEMQRRLDEQTELELALRRAVANDELVMHIQPVFDLVENRVMGGEALVRWMRPGHGLVPPGDFIPVAERSDLILDLERWVLTQACERLVAWREREPATDRRIAVNISGRHLAEGDLVADVREVLDETGADPTLLELELTETHLLEDMERATLALDQIRSLGITIAVDDFGTGYSSMTYLRELPVDVLKIDRTFVARATDHGYDSTVIEAVLAIARTLELSVVAEGIETGEQLDYVRSRGCDAAQGFLMARPMPVEDAERVIFATTAPDVRANASDDASDDASVGTGA